MQQQERIYEWEVAEIGDESQPMVVQVTEETIRDYVDAIRHDDPAYTDPALYHRTGFGGLVAPPASVFKIAPMRRMDAINGKGYIAPEQSQVSPRATPYVASDVHFFRPIRPGDTITSTTKVADKYERRGNRYIVWQITGTNQNGEKVVEYTYTCLWHYAKGRRIRQNGETATSEQPR